MNHKSAAVFLLFVLLIIFRYVSTRPKFTDGDVVKITTTVTSEPIQYTDSQYLKLYGLKTYLPKYPEVNYGDEIIVVGRVEDGKLVGLESVEIGQHKKGLYVLRENIISFFKKSLPEPHSSLVAGSVLGSKQMPETFWDSLRKTGTAHIVVASGTNVTMVSGFLMGIFTFFLKRRKAVIFTVGGILVYVVISGFDAPIVRAAIMGTVAFTAQVSGRLVSAWKALLYSIVVMLLIKPDWIIDLGFILSVLATSGLMLFQKNIDKKLQILPKIFREGLTTSLAAQIFVAPVIFVTFGQFNMLSPLINAVILWTIPYIMVIGGISAVIGLVAPELGSIILTLEYPLTWYFINILSLF